MLININLWQILKIIWPILVLVGFVFLFQIIFEVIIPALFARNKRNRNFKDGHQWRDDRDLIRWLRGMSPNEFEEYIADLFNRLGYQAKAIGQSHDGGIDVVAEKNSIRHYIQCKKFITSEVGVGAVRDFYGAIADHLTSGKGSFITTNKFTFEAEKFAEDKPIELVDSFKLVEMIKSTSKK